MAKFILALSCILLTFYQVASQFLPRPVETIETPRNVIRKPYPIFENPSPYIVPVPQRAPSTTIITDCSPATCKNLANTLQLLIVSNLLQNTIGGSELALGLSNQILNDLLGSSTLPCGCANPFINAGSPNIIPNGIISPNVIFPDHIAPKVLPNIVSPSFGSPYPVNLANLISGLIQS
ncbi:hypothetical protein evm_012986 [Chilo suppressalis]|nr:hypothetical protein evm_012986 [Chilo suppressalis]